MEPIFYTNQLKVWNSLIKSLKFIETHLQNPIKSNHSLRGFFCNNRVKMKIYHVINNIGGEGYDNSGMLITLKIRGFMWLVGVYHLIDETHRTSAKFTLWYSQRVVATQLKMCSQVSIFIYLFIFARKLGTNLVIE